MQDSGTLSTEQNGDYMVAKDSQGNMVDPIKIYSQDQHIYAEGPDLLISDILLYPCIYLVLQSQAGDVIRKKFPVISRWFDKVSETEAPQKVLDELLAVREEISRDFVDVEPKVVADASLYKCDPNRDDCKNFTIKMDVQRNLKWWEESGIANLQSYAGPTNGEGLDWNSLPKLAHPQAGELPAARLNRKCDQLQGLALPLMEIVNKKRDGCLLVDFCSGGGHLGLLLAHSLPKAVVHMVENKEESLARARERGQLLNLTNVWYFQANMEYYKGSFEVGTSLHACGVATDLVITKCMEQQADYVCTPCCYGAVRSIDSIHYPRSSAFRGAGCTEKDYIMMGHTADQTNKDPEKTRHTDAEKIPSETATKVSSETLYKSEEGNLFMDIVDSDRALLSMEKGYSVRLDKIYPLTCSPKHNIIIATHIK